MNDNVNHNVTIDQVFPAHIGYVFNPHHNEIEKELTDHCLELKKTVKKGGDTWISNKTYTTCGTYNVLNDPKFLKLNDWVNEKIDEFITALTFNKKNWKCHVGWFNIYEKYDYQEYHSHRPYIISCTYFLKSDEKAAPLWIKNDREFLLYSDHLASDGRITPHPGKLVIFSSDVLHSVGRSESDDTRISIAYNYGY